MPIYTTGKLRVKLKEFLEKRSSFCFIMSSVDLGLWCNSSITAVDTQWYGCNSRQVHEFTLKSSILNYCHSFRTKT